MQGMKTELILESVVCYGDSLVGLVDLSRGGIRTWMFSGSE